METRVEAMSGQGTAVFGLPQLEQAENNLAIEYLWEISYDIEKMTVYIADNEYELMEDQLDVYKTIILRMIQVKLAKLLSSALHWLNCAK